MTSLRVVHARDLSVLDPTDDEVLTLITCYPFTLLGRAPDRFIVRAARVAAVAACRRIPDAALRRERRAICSESHERSGG